MMYLKAAAFTAATIVGLGTSVAADVPYIVDVPQIVEAPQPVAIGGGWYLRGDVGMSVRTEADFYNADVVDARNNGYYPNGEFVHTDLGEGASVGVGAGYRFSKFFRADVTAEFRGSIDITATDKRGYDSYEQFYFHRGSLNSQVFLANAYADIGTFGRLSPFIGVGIGTARHEIDGAHKWDPQNNIGFFDKDKDSKSQWDLAYAVHAGLGYKASKNLTLEAGYRYLNMGDAVGSKQRQAQTCLCEHEGNELKDIDSHEIRLGMRWEFGGEDHYVEPMPVSYTDIPYKR